MTRSLTLRAGPDALRLIRERGLRADDVDIMPGASGGAKWLAIAGLDHYLFSRFYGERTRPLHLIGSSIGSWRMACFAQRDPLAALARGHHAYIYDQRYTTHPSAAEVTRVLGGALDQILGATGAAEILQHPFARLHVITAEGRGLAASASRAGISAALAAAALGNLVSRRTLAWQLTRYVFHSAGDESPFQQLSDLPTRHLPLTVENLRAVLLASGSIPLLLEGVRIPGLPDAVHWDGGVLDYHLDIDFGPGDGLVLYPHFYSHVVPGWFDKNLRWRRAGGRNFRRTLLIAPSDEFVARLPGARIPDRRDFFRLSHADRERRWQGVADASEELGHEFERLVTSGRIADVVQPW